MPLLKPTISILFLTCVQGKKLDTFFSWMVVDIECSMEGREGLPIDKSFPTSALDSVKYHH